MNSTTKHKILTCAIAAVWLANGLFCKVLHFVPRHEEIVGRILGNTHSRLITISIGLSEMLMTVWILCGIMTRLNAVTQILIIAAMNTLEFFLVPDLLMWGRGNAVYAIIFILLIYYNEFCLNKVIGQKK